MMHTGTWLYWVRLAVELAHRSLTTPHSRVAAYE